MKFMVVVVFLIARTHCETDVTDLGTTESTRGIFDYLDSGPKPMFCPCQCGVPNIAKGISSRFLGGYTVSDHEYPWIVLIHIQDAPTASGTLINDRYVITTASILYGLTPSEIKVTIGGYDRCFPDTISSNQSVNSVILHPGYDPLTRGNDLGLLRLTSVLTIDKYVQPICLPKPELDYHNYVTQIIGWSRGKSDDSQNSLSCRPKRIGFAVMANYECLQLAGDRYTSDKTCFGNGGSTTLMCPNDAGLAASHLAQDGRYELIGVVSEQNTCGDAGESVIGVSLYTRLNVHFGWLFENTKDSCYCTKI